MKKMQKNYAIAKIRDINMLKLFANKNYAVTIIRP